MTARLVVCSTLHHVPDRPFGHRLHWVEGRADPNFAQHVKNLTGYVYTRGRQDWSGNKIEVWRHLSRAKWLLDLAVEETELAACRDWLRRANAISMDATTPASVRDPAGRVLVAADGAQDPTAEVPHPPEARARKARSEALLRERNVKFFDGLPPVVGESEVEPRAASEVALRAMALHVAARWAGSLAMRMGDVTLLPRRWPVACAAFTPTEAAVLKNEGAGGEELVTLAEDDECARTLFWALGALPLPPLAESGDQTLLDDLMMNIAESDFVAGARLRPIGEILDELDLQLRRHWAMQRQMEVDASELPPYSEAMAFQRRNRALTWLTRNDDADWDEVLAPP